MGYKAADTPAKGRTDKGTHEMMNITDMLDRSADLYPDRIAFSDPSKSITFEELQRNAKQAACAFLSGNVLPKTDPGRAVAFYMEKSVRIFDCFI